MAIVRWGKQRRFLMLAALALAAVAVVAILALKPAAAPATSGGDPYSVPDVTDTNPDPHIVETTIVADEATVDLGNGVTANAQTFNGTIPGPTFRLNVGDLVIVHYENHLDKPSAIHWHGIELANEMDGTPFTQNQAEPGGTFLYRFKVTRPGLFWYHPHHHSSTNQVFKGLYGMIIVTDPNEAALQNSGTLPSPDQTRAMVLSDTTVCKAPGSNDNATYDPSAPWVGGGALPPQPGPSPKSLCETAPIDEDGAARGPFNEHDIPNIQTQAHSGRTNEGQTVLTNGMNVGARAGDPSAPGALSQGARQMDVKAGQGLRLQVLNAAAIRYMRLRLTTSTGVKVPLVHVGGEGGLLSNAAIDGGVAPGGFDTLYDSGEALIPGGSRLDLVAAIPSNATGTLTLWTEDYQRTGQNPFYTKIPTVPVAHFHVNGTQAPPYTLPAGTPLRAATGDPVPALPAPTGTLLNPATFAPTPKPGLAAQNIQLNTEASSLSVDHVFGTHDVGGDYTQAAHLGSSRYAKEGDVLELTVQNETDAHHPFHLHGFSIQPISLTPDDNAKPTFTYPYREFRDNVDVPGRYTLKFRVKIEPRPLADGVTPGGALGRWVFHCHIFFHATNGMLGEVTVTAPSGNERPDVNVNGDVVEVQQGQTATMQGTYFDRDGEAVTLSSSVGTVTDDGGGKFTWTYPTGTDKDQTVYITGTDLGGRKGQIPFTLKVDNSPPSLILPGAQSFASGSPAAFGVAAMDPDQPDTVTLSAADLPAGLTFKDNGDRTGSVSGIVTAPPGNYVATFTTSDGIHTPVSGTVNITVTEAVSTLSALVERPERMSKKGTITVGCLLDTPALQSCRADVIAGGKRVGRATKTVNGANAKALVKVKLNSKTRRKVARSLRGVKVQVKLLALKTGSATPLTAQRTTRVVPIKVTKSLRAFSAGSSKPSRKARKFLASVAKQVGSAKKVTCLGFADVRGGLRLGKKRGTAACAQLQLRGLKAKLVAAGSSHVRERNLSLAIVR